MERRVLDEPFELFRIIGTAVVSGPGVTDGEFVELEHVHDPNLSYCTAEELRLLVHTCPHKQAAVGSSVDGDPAGCGVSFLEEVFGSTLEVIKTVLLVSKSASFVPSLAILSTSSDVCYSQDPTQVSNKEQVCSIVIWLN